MKDCSRALWWGLCLMLLALAQVAFAARLEERGLRFQEASASYSRGEYGAAINGFEGLTRQGVSAPLLYNLGNSYARAGQSGLAILNYERALLLVPGDSDIRANLELVRRDQGLFQEEPSLVQRFVTLLGLNQWLSLAAMALVVFTALLVLPASMALKRSLRNGLAGVTILVTVATALGTVAQYRHWHEGVVVVSGARLRVSPFGSAASLGVIQEGRLLHPGKMHNGFSLVVDETGRSGWLDRADYGLIATP